jgi:hypothetical protein
VVSTLLKNISQLGLLFPIYGNIKNVPNHQPTSLYHEHIHENHSKEKMEGEGSELSKVLYPRSWPFNLPTSRNYARNKQFTPGIPQKSWSKPS